MDARLSKFTDQQLALLLGQLNDGREGMVSRVICEVSYRLLRAGGSALTVEEDELLDDLMTCVFRLRENNRRHRRNTRSLSPGGRQQTGKPGATLKLVALVKKVR
jgi:hypothetical protein